MAMKSLFNHVYSLGYLIGLLSAFGMACSSSDEAHGGGRVEYPVDPRPKIPPSPPAGSASAMPSQHAFLSPSDKAIAQDYPSRPWSKNVPKRTCLKDDECGDGFCDRGRCAAIWTWSASLGQRCRDGTQCADYLCIDGRCRSCVADAECIDEPENQQPRCMDEPFVPGSHGCVGVTPGGGLDSTPVPLPAGL